MRCNKPIHGHSGLCIQENGPTPKEKAQVQGLAARGHTRGVSARFPQENSVNPCDLPLQSDQTDSFHDLVYTTNCTFNSHRQFIALQMQFALIPALQKMLLHRDGLVFFKPAQQERGFHSIAPWTKPDENTPEMALSQTYGIRSEDERVGRVTTDAGPLP